MEVVPYANAPRHVNTSADSQNSILDRSCSAFSKGVLPATLVTPPYRYYREIQSYISTFSSSNQLGKVSENLLDHPLTKFVPCFALSVAATGGQVYKRMEPPQIQRKTCSSLGSWMVWSNIACTVASLTRQQYTKDLPMQDPRYSFINLRFIFKTNWFFFLPLYQKTFAGYRVEKCMLF